MGVKREREMRLDLSSDDAFSACLDTLQNLGYKITASDQTYGYIEAKVRISMLSWGETINIQISSLSPTSCSLTLQSQSTWFTLVDWGKNDENLEAIHWRLSRLLQ